MDMSDINLVFVATHSAFVVPYQKYVKSITNQLPIGSRFKMRLDMDDYPERRFSGVVTGIGDLDHYRWPKSKWRCLLVHTAFPLT
ncbi:unnamed protein product [Ilex paraguariensis]|uniref:Auxin response factor domain-containing protein n=1 Tax=Ilex paraguariensis TaxID=185542 RepID=A0ABC8SYS7_9AQUA